MTKIEVSKQVSDFIRQQAPEPRRRLKAGLKNLAFERGDIRALEGALEGYHRLRVFGFRIIFAYCIRRGSKSMIRCIYVERRGVVYEIFERLLKEKLLEEGKS